MENRALLLVGGAGLLVGVAIGYALSASWTGRGPMGSAEIERAAAEVAANAVARLAELQHEHTALRAEYERVLRAPESRTEINGMPDLSAGLQTVEAGTGGPGSALPVSFGTWAEEPALRAADWVDMGIRARDLVMARGAGIGGGQLPAMAALEKRAIRELQGHLDRIATRRPGLAGHPVVVVNLMASHLEQAEKPFQPWQIEAIESAGRQYEVRAERMREESSRAEALASEGKLRSIQLRKELVDRIVAEVLTREQWDVLFDAETKGLLYYDVYQVGGLELERPNSSVYWRDVRADAVEHLKLFLLTEWELSREDLERLGSLVEEWIDAIRALPRVPGHPTSALHIDEVLPCVEVHVEFQKKVIGVLAGEGEKAQRVRASTVYAVFPRLRR